MNDRGHHPLWLHQLVEMFQHTADFLQHHARLRLIGFKFRFIQIPAERFTDLILIL